MQTFSVTNLPKLELLNVTVEPVTYRDRPAMRLLETDPTSDQECLAILPDSKFKDGEIETMIAGSPRPDAPADMRGFVGIAFRVQPQASQFEVFY
jgi:hypothetical protein